MISTAYLQISLIIYAYMTLIFFLAQIKKNNSIADIAWGIGFIVITIFTFFFHGNHSWEKIVTSTLVIIWGLRISSYIMIRNWNKEEDPRYKKWRNSWGNNFIIRSFFQIYMLQGLIMLIIALPIILINTNVTVASVSLLSLLGLFIWIIGFICENIGDYQLYTFLKNKNNHGKIMTQGIWKYTRHPNYFGEAIMWWGIWLIAYATTPYGIYSIISPVLITYLLIYVSGIPLAEESFINNDDYKQYQKTTSSFFPLPPKK